MTLLYKKINRGFSLIELLIVLLIIGITASIATISLHTNNKKQINRTAQILIAQLKLASTEALFTNTTLSLITTKNGWQFERLKKADEKNYWQPVKAIGLKTKSIQKMLTIKIIKPKNRIIITPDGFLTPFSILLETKKRPTTLTINGANNGTIQIKLNDENQP